MIRLRTKKNEIISKGFLLSTLAFLCVLVALGFRFGYSEGDSMEPTMYNAITIQIRPVGLKPGDIVVALDPQLKDYPELQKDCGKYICKRVMWVTDSQVFLQGDNTEVSYDSRQFGPVPRSDVCSKIIWYINWS